MRALCALTGILLSYLGAQSSAQQAPKETPKQEWRDIISIGLSGSDCKPTASSQDQGGRICKGAEGYSLLLRGDERKPEIYLIGPGGRRYPLHYWNTSDPYYEGLRSYATWVVVNVPRRTIAVVFTAEIAPKQDYSYNGSYDIATRKPPDEH